MRKRFSEEFKTEALRLVRETGTTVEQASKDLGVGKSTLTRWLSESAGSPELPPLSINEREELKQLRKENAQLKLEREILKKASAYFAKQYL